MLDLLPRVLLSASVIESRFEDVWCVHTASLSMDMRSVGLKKSCESLQFISQNAN